MTLEELIAIPELDQWRYSSIPNRAFTPGTFVAEALKILGVFHGEEINPGEFTVPDVYKLDIYDSEFQRPDECWEADYQLQYCQLFGKYRMELPGYNTIHPYRNMNDSCPNQFESSYNDLKC